MTGSMNNPAQPPSDTHGRRIPSLDGIRALAVLLVVVGHAAARLDDGPLRSVLVRFVGNSALGVSIFFVLSGFLITTILLAERERTGSISLFRFYVRRTFRIIPPFYAYVAVISAMAVAGVIVVPRGDVIEAMLFVWNYTRHETWYLAHTWSLSVEEQFYLLWPIALIATLRLGLSAKLAIALICLGPVFRVATWVALPEYRDQLGSMLQSRMDSLMAGCLIALCYDSRWLRWAKAVAHRREALLATATFLLVVSPLLTWAVGAAWHASAGYTLEAVAIASLMVWLIEHPRSIVGRLLNARVVVHVGVISYSLYLWQELFLTPDYSWAGSAFPLNLVLAFGAAELSYRLIERPSLRWRNRFLASRRPASATATATSFQPTRSD